METARSRGHQLEGLVLVGTGVVQLPARAQEMAEGERKQSQTKTREDIQGGAAGREVEDGQHVATTLKGVGVKCCVMQEKEHRGERSGGADPGEKLSSPSMFQPEERMTRKTMGARTLTKAAATLCKLREQYSYTCEGQSISVFCI